MYMRRLAIRLFAFFLLGRMVCGAEALPEPVARTFGQPPLPARGWIDDFSYSYSYGGGLEFSPNGRRLLVSNGRKGQVYDVQTLKPACEPFPADWNASECSYVADGSLIFATGEVGPLPMRRRAQYFDAATGKPVSAPFTCDGKYGESSSSSNGKYVCQTFAKENGHVIRVIERQTSRVVYSKTSDDIEWEPGLNADGSVLKFNDSGSQYGLDGAFHLVRVRDGKALLVSELESDARPRCQFSPNGKSVLLIGGASGLRIFDLASEKMIAQIPDAKTGKYVAGDLGYPEFDTNGREVLFGRKGGQRRWSIGTGAVSNVATQPAEDHVVVATSRDGRRAFCTYGSDPYNGSVSGKDVVDLASGKPIWKYPSNGEQYTTQLAMSSDGRRVAISFANRNRIFLVDLDDLGAAAPATKIPAPPIPTRIGQPPLQVRGRIDAGSDEDHIRFSPDDKNILISNNHRATVWDASLSTAKSLALPSNWNGLNPWGTDFMNGGAIIFCYSGEYAPKKEKIMAQCFDAISFKLAGPGLEASGHGWIVCSDDGRYLATTYGEDVFPAVTQLRVIDRPTAKVVFARTFNGPLASIHRLSRDGRFLIYEEFGGKAGEAVMRVMRVADGKHLFVDELKPRTVAFHEAVNFSPDGKSVVIGELDGFKVFDLETEKPLYVSPSFKPSDDGWKSLPVREARFSDNGSSVVYRQETDLRRWNVVERRFLPVFAWKGELRQVSMSRDAHRMTCNYETGDVAPDEGTAMFDLDSGKCVWKWSRPWIWGNAVLSGNGKRALVTDTVHQSIYAIDFGEGQ
jgi:hypothetical protein